MNSSLDNDRKKLEKAKQEAQSLLNKLTQPKPRKRQRKEWVEYPIRDIKGNLICHPPKKRKKATDQDHPNNQAIHDPAEDNITSVQKLRDQINEALYNLETSVDYSPGPTLWERRKEKEIDNWEKCRNTFFEARLKKFSPFNNVSLECCKCDQPAAIRCTQCREILCQRCDNEQHIYNGLHDREFIVGQHWAYGQPLQWISNDNGPPRIVEVERYLPVFPKVCPCGTADSIEQFTITRRFKVIAVTELGRYDILLPFVNCPHCNRDLTPQTEDIITGGFWPGSARMHDGMYIFSDEVLCLFDFLKLEKAGLSVKAFVTSLQFMSSTRGRNSIISQKIFNESFREWRRCKFEVEKISKTNEMACPACSDDIHACHLDGNRKLYRFKNRAVSKEENYFKDVFIMDDGKVDDMVKKIQFSGVQEKSSICGESHWKAAKSSSKSMKNLDETGLVVGCCKHAIMLKGLNMFQGEIYAYPMVLQLTLLEDFNSLQFICQDVVCKYYPWMLKVLEKQIDIQGIEKLKYCKPFLSIMHGKAHDWSCQILYGGRWQEGSGTVTGEEMEQCNSYISTAGLTTKNMSKTAREEELTMHVLHWNRKKKEKLPIQLTSSYVKIRKNIEQLKIELNELKKYGNILLTDADLESWENSLKEMAKDSRKKTSDSQLSEVEKFFLLSIFKRDSENLGLFVDKSDAVTVLLAGNRNLHKAASDFKKQNKEEELNYLHKRLCCSGKTEEEIFEAGRNSLATKKAKLYQNMIEMAFTSIKQREMEITKVADTSKIRHRLRRKLADEKKVIKNLVADYNLVCQTTDPISPLLEEEDAISGNWPWIRVSGPDCIPTRVKRLLVDKKMDLAKNEEELNLIVTDMRNTLSMTLELKSSLENAMTSVTDKLKTDNCEIKDVYPNKCNPRRYQFQENSTREALNGCLAVLEQRHALTVLHARKCCAQFRDIINDVPLKVEMDFKDIEDYSEDEDDIEDYDVDKIIDNLEGFEFLETDNIEF